MNKIKVISGILVIVFVVSFTWKIQDIRYQKKIAELNIAELNAELNYLRVELDIARKLNSDYEKDKLSLEDKLKDVQKSKAAVDSKLRDANNRVYILSGGCSEGESSNSSVRLGESRPFISSGSFGRISDRIYKAAEWAEQLNYCIDRYNNVRESLANNRD